MRLGFNQKTYYGLNPLPESVDEAQLLKDADLELFEPSVVHPFYMSFKYASGHDQEWVRLLPGQRIALREGVETDAFQSNLGQIGGVLIPEGATDAEALELIIQGLRVAEKHYRDNGELKVKKMMRERGISKDEAKEYRYDYWPYFLNQAKSDVIRTALKQAQAALLDARAAEAEAVETEEE